MNLSATRKYILAFTLGALAVFSFAPFVLFPLIVLIIAALFWLWLQASSAREAAGLGFVFGMGLFCVGTGWIYVALHDYGGMNFLLAMLATGLFAAVCSVMPALAGYLQARYIQSRFCQSRLDQSRLAAPNWVRLTLVMPAAWVLMEWVRGLIFTGFPWLAAGYSQVTVSPLAGYAPVLGVYGVSLAVGVSAGLLVLLAQARWSRQGKAAVVAVLLIWCVGGGLRLVEWSAPEGPPITVALVQGNIPQDLKFREEKLLPTLETYRRLTQNLDAQLIVLPESALPMLRHEVPEDYLAQLRQQVRGGDMIIGAFEHEQGRYYNSVFTLGTADSQSYRKNHLVPFGEFIPWRPVFGWLINNVLNIPMSDLARGGERQPLLRIAGQRVAVAICYEDVFGEEVIRYLPEASLLVNVSNDAWYGDSLAAIQHNQIAQMRALESGRMMLRATNTGVTSIIGRDGVVQASLPQHQEGVLIGTVQGYQGSTPYARWGNAGVLGLLGLLGIAAIAVGRLRKK